MRSCHEYGEADFTALAAGDPGGIAARRLRRHLAACEECRSQWEEVTRMFTLAAESERTAPLTTDLAERVRAAALPPASVVAPRRRRLTFVALTGGAAVTTAVASLLLLTPGAPLRPVPAFARVEEAMYQVRTATWRETHTQSFPARLRKNPQTGQREPDGPVLTQERVHENWLQMDPPRLSTRRVSDSDRHPREWFSVTDGRHEVSRSLHLEDPSLPPIYYRSDADEELRTMEGGPPPADPRERVARTILFPRSAGGQGPQTYEHTYPTGGGHTVVRSAWVAHRDTLRGERVLRFESRQTVVHPANPALRMPEARRHVDWKVWVDPETFRVVRREIGSPPGDPLGFHWKTVSEDFRYNVRPPATAFEVPRPPLNRWFRYNDYTREGVALRRTRPEEKREMVRLIHRAVAAWNRRDPDALLSLWDFEHSARMGAALHGTPVDRKAIEGRRRHWRARVTKGIPYRSWRVTDMRNLDWGLGGDVMVLRSEDEAFPPAARRPDRFHAGVDCAAVLQDGRRVPDAHTIFEIVRSEDGRFRIVSMNMSERLFGRGGRPAREGAATARRSGTATRPAGRR